MNHYFDLRILGERTWDPVNDNIDIEVTLPDGRRFCATFFTIDNIRSLFEKNKRTGECGSGTYLWASEMIIIRELTLSAINRSITQMLRDNEFMNAFRELP